MDYGMDKFFRTQGQVILRLLVSLAKVLTVHDFMPVLFICKFHNNLIKKFSAQEQITPK